MQDDFKKQDDYILILHGWINHLNGHFWVTKHYPAVKILFGILIFNAQCKCFTNGDWPVRLILFNKAMNMKKQIFFEGSAPCFTKFIHQIYFMRQQLSFSNWFSFHLIDGFVPKNNTPFVLSSKNILLKKHYTFFLIYILLLAMS